MQLTGNDSAEYFAPVGWVPAVVMTRLSALQPLQSQLVREALETGKVFALHTVNTP